MHDIINISPRRGVAAVTLRSPDISRDVARRVAWRPSTIGVRLRVLLFHSKSNHMLGQNCLSQNYYGFQYMYTVKFYISGKHIDVLSISASISVPCDSLGSPGLPWLPLGDPGGSIWDSPGLPLAPWGSPGLPWVPLDGSSVELVRENTSLKTPRSSIQTGRNFQRTIAIMQRKKHG